MTRNDLTNCFWENLDAIIAARGMDYTYLCMKTGISYKSFTGSKYKGRIPSIEIIVTLADFLDCSVDYLVERYHGDRWAQYIKALELATAKDLNVIRAVLGIAPDDNDSATEAGRKLG